MDFAPYQDSSPEIERALSPPPKGRPSLDSPRIRSPPPQNRPGQMNTRGISEIQSLPPPDAFTDDLPERPFLAGAERGQSLEAFETSLPLRIDHEAALAYLLLPPAGGVPVSRYGEAACLAHGKLKVFCLLEINAMVRYVRLGILVPSSNTALEPLTNAIISSIQSEGLVVTAHFSRFRVTTIDLSATANAQFDLAPILDASKLLADAKVDVIGWSGTSAGWLGFEHDEKLCEAIEEETGIRATTSVLSLNAILRSLGVISLGLVTPYTKDVNDRIRSNYETIGVDINEKWAHHLGITDNIEVAKLDEATLDGMVMDVAAHGAHVLSTFCTNLRAAQRVELWESTLSITVIDTVASVIWGLLKIVEVDTRLVQGFGFIFDVD